MKIVKQRIMAVIISFFSLFLLAGCGKSNAQSNKTPENTVIASEKDSSEEDSKENEIEQVDYFSEISNLPIPSSLYPDLFSENGQNEFNNIIAYSYNFLSSDTEEIKTSYRKYLEYITKEKGFDIKDASDEVSPGAAYLLYGGEVIGVVGVDNDSTTITLSVCLGDGIKSVYNRFHGSEQSSNSGNVAGSLTLSQGNYSVPKDIPAGTYNVEINSSDQNAVSSLYYKKNGKAKGIYAITSERGFHALTLEEGDSLEISGDSVILKKSY